MIKASKTEQGRFVIYRIARPIGNEHFRQGLAHSSSFGRVIVDKDDRLKPQVEVCGQSDNVLGLVLPIDAPGCKIIQAQNHFPVASDCFQGGCFVVLACYRQENSASGQALERQLKILECFTDGLRPSQAHFFPTYLADDSAPERVVQIHDREFS